MKTGPLLLRSLLHYWRTNLAVLLGVVAATAVIGGALVVGDSVRDSLKQMSLDRLGNVSHALSGGRFVREDLADLLSGDLNPTAAFMGGKMQVEGDMSVAMKLGSIV